MREPDEHGAAALRVGLQLGLVSVADVIHWADERIGAMDQPPEALLELGLMSHASRADVLRRLGQLSAGVPALEVLPRVLGSGANRLRADPRLGPVVAHGLYEVYMESSFQVPETFRPIGEFDDRYELARQGTYGSEAEVYRDLVTFAARFEAHG